MPTPDHQRRTKIVATIGPATESPDSIRQLILAGATTFRLNFSHGDHEEHAQRAATIRQVAHELGVHVGILQDLQGPKIRLGRFADGPITVAKGDSFALTARDVPCSQTIATVTYDKLATEVEPGSRILLDDGKVEMKVDWIDQAEQTLHCKVTVGGKLSNNKGVNFPDCLLSVRALTAKDRNDLAFGLQLGVDWVALSFVRNPSDMQEIKELISSLISCMSEGLRTKLRATQSTPSCNPKARSLRSLAVSARTERRQSGKLTPLLLESLPPTVTLQCRVCSAWSIQSTFISTLPSSRRMRLPGSTSVASLS